MGVRNNQSEENKEKRRKVKKQQNKKESWRRYALGRLNSHRGNHGFQTSDEAMWLQEFKSMYDTNRGDVCETSTGDTCWEIGPVVPKAESTFENIYLSVF